MENIGFLLIKICSAKVMVVMVTRRSIDLLGGISLAYQNIGEGGGGVEIKNKCLLNSNISKKYGRAHTT
jgi:hypothetical protein